MHFAFHLGSYLGTKCNSPTRLSCSKVNSTSHSSHGTHTTTTSTSPLRYHSSLPKFQVQRLCTFSTHVTHQVISRVIQKMASKMASLIAHSHTPVPGTLSTTNKIQLLGSLSVGSMKIRSLAAWWKGPWSKKLIPPAKDYPSQALRRLKLQPTTFLQTHERPWARTM